MTNQPSNVKRTVVVGSAVFLLLAVVLVGRNRIIGSRRIGQFTAPSLSGWQSEISRPPKEDIIFYSKDELHITLRWLKSRSGNSPKTIQDMQKEEVKEQQWKATFNKKFHINMHQQRVLNQATTLNGMPALLTQDVFRDTSPHSTIYSKTLRFINANNLYRLNSTISVPDKSPVPGDDQLELDQAWTQITDSLH